MVTPTSDLGPLITAKRGAMSIRQAAVIAGISPAALSRFEHGGTPDLMNFARLCRWLEIDPVAYLEAASLGRRGR